MTDLGEQQRRELGTFLRARRERTSPAEVGLPDAPRRRTPGLRREELAVLAGISPTWYTFLEQGRDVRASRQVLGALARALRLDDVERDHLFTIATEVVEPSNDLQRSADPEVTRIVDLLDPEPAYVTGPVFDLLAVNRAASTLFRGAVSPERQPNLARWVFLDPAARDVLPDWSDVAKGLLARLRARAGQHTNEPAFHELVADLRQGSREADRWWPRYDVGTSRAGIKRVRREDGVEQQLTYTSFEVAERPMQTLTVYLRI